MSVFFVNDEVRITIRGKTYPYRDLIRSLGGQYEAGEKIWSLPYSPENLQKVSELCKSIGGGPQKGEKKAVPERERQAVPDAVLPSLQGASAQIPSSVEDGFSIAEVMRQAQLAIMQSFPRSIWVLGEVQNIRWHSSGCFLQLADFKEGASKSATVTINATIWNTSLRDLERRFGKDEIKALLQDGIRIRVLADVAFFKDRGQISLQIQGIDPNYTKGSLALAREKLLRDLRSKGLDRRQKTLRVPAFPFRIGLLSAEDSRAKSDFLDQLRVYGFPGEVIFQATQMQGENTLREVVLGLRQLEAAGCDLIVLTRGGGSAADLRWFDSPEIAYAIAESKIAVVAAIGHHEDVCVAEEICFQREKTPTAAADFVLSLFMKTRERIEQLALVISRQLNERIKLFDAGLMQVTERMRGSVQAMFHDQTRALDQLAGNLELQAQRRIFYWSTRLDQASTRLNHALNLRETQERAAIGHLVQTLDREIDRAFQHRRRELDALEAQLQRKDPQPWMKEGWTQLFDTNGTIREGRRLREGQMIKARLPDSVLDLTVSGIHDAGGESE